MLPCLCSLHSNDVMEKGGLFAQCVRGHAM